MTKSKKDLTVVDQEFASQLAAVTQDQSAEAGEVAFMRFSKGEWVFGAEDNEVSEGSLWAVNLKSFHHGYIVWDDGELVEEVMTALGTPQTAIPAEHIKLAKEEKEYSANPQVAFQMLCIKGEEKDTVVSFSASSVGGRKAVARLLKKVTAKATAGEPYVAVVALDVDSYKHKTYGKVFTPVFEIEEFITEAELVEYGQGVPDDGNSEEGDSVDDAAAQTDIEDENKAGKTDQPAPQRTRRRR